MALTRSIMDRAANMSKKLFFHGPSHEMSKKVCERGDQHIKLSNYHGKMLQKLSQNKRFSQKWKATCHWSTIIKTTKNHKAKRGSTSSSLNLEKVQNFVGESSSLLPVLRMLWLDALREFLSLLGLLCSSAGPRRSSSIWAAARSRSSSARSSGGYNPSKNIN